MLQPRKIAWLVLFAAVAIYACGREGERQVGDEEVFSVQLHVHGSFSEGMGSIDSHSYEARDVGVDVLWWSDHDFRVTGHQLIRHYGFEAWGEPVDRGEDWSVLLERHADDTKGLTPVASMKGASAELVTDPVREGGKSLRMRCANPTEAFAPLAHVFQSTRETHRTSLALGLILRLAVLPVAHGPDARAFLEVYLSEHAPREGLALEQYRVRYVLSNTITEPVRQGPIYRVPVAYEPGEWNDLELDLATDAARGFPFVPQRDDVFFRFVLGVESRNGAEVEAVFDDLRVDRRIFGPAAFDVQSEVIADVATAYPTLRQLQGVEISLVGRHLNEYSREHEPLDYDAIAAEVGDGGDADARFRKLVVERAVAAAHARGGLISYNHMFGISMEGAPKRRTREEQLALMLESRAYGADVLEVGYRDRGGATLADHLWVWDRMGLAGLRLVGVGVSDSHGGPEERWRGRPNNFVSWIFAAAPEKADLIEGLRAGRVFFGDIELFDGTLDLVTAEGARMGDVVRSSGGRTIVEIRVRGTKGGERLVVVEGGEAVAEYAIDGGEAKLRHELSLPADRDTLVRVELYDAGGREMAFSNPIWFVRDER